MLDGQDLRIIVTIAEHGSLVKAGRVPGMSQPSLTRSLAQVEERLGATLFDRSRRGRRSWRSWIPWPHRWKPCVAPRSRR